MVANALTSLATKYTLLHYSEPSVIITNFIRQTTQSKNAYNHQRRKKVGKKYILWAANVCLVRGEVEDSSLGSFTYHTT